MGKRLCDAYGLQVNLASNQPEDDPVRSANEAGTGPRVDLNFPGLRNSNSHGNNIMNIRSTK